MGPNRTQRWARVPIQDAEAFLVGRLSSITKLPIFCSTLNRWLSDNGFRGLSPGLSQPVWTGTWRQV